MRVLIAIAIVYFTVANYCNFKRSLIDLGVPVTTTCPKTCSRN